MDGQQEIIKMRNHITSVIEEIWGIVLVLICLVLGNGESFSLGVELIRSGNIIQGLLAAGGVSLLLLFICLWRINRWYHTALTIKEGNVTYERRTLSRRVNTIAVINISNINLEQNIFERIVGTCKVKLDTNSLSTANSTDLQILLKKRDAERVKLLLLQMIQESQASGQRENQLGQLEENLANEMAEADANGAIGRKSVSVGLNPLLEKHLALDDDGVDFDIVYSAKDIIRNCLVTTYLSLWILMVIVCVGSVGMIIDALDGDEDILEVFSLIVVQFMFVGTWIVSLVKRALQDFMFRARRDGDKIYVSCGLIKKKKYAVPIDKINAVSIEYTFLGRLCKKAYVKVINVGGEGEDVDGMKILLADSYGELERKMKLILPEFDLPEPSVLKKPPLCALWFSIGKLGLFFIAVIGGILLGIRFGGVFFDFTAEELKSMLAGIFPYSCIGGLLLFLLCTVVCLMHYLAAGIYQGERLVVSRGIFAKRILTMQYQRIQYIHISQGPLERMVGLGRGHFTILASSMSRIQNIGCFGREEFERMSQKFRETY